MCRIERASPGPTANVPPPPAPGRQPAGQGRRAPADVQDRAGVAGPDGERAAPPGRLVLPGDVDAPRPYPAGQGRAETDVRDLGAAQRETGLLADVHQPVR